jgi:hypothetical protein
VIGLITDDDETDYREEISDFLSLSGSKTKELIVYNRKLSTKHAPIHIDRAVVKQIERCPHHQGLNIEYGNFLASDR